MSSRIKLQDEDEDDNDDFADYLPYGSSSLRGDGRHNRVNNNNPMQSLADELDELTRSLSLGDTDADVLRRTAYNAGTGYHNPLPSFGSLQYSSVDSAASGDRQSLERDTDVFSSRPRQNLNKYLQEEDEEEETLPPPRARADPPTREATTRRGFTTDEDASFATPTEPIHTNQQRSYSSSAAANRTRDSASFSAAAQTPMEPPVNLQSPPFRLFSPPTEQQQQPPSSSSSNRRKNPSTTSTATTSNKKKTARSRGLFPEPQQQMPMPTPPSPIRSSSSWQPLLQDMKQTLEEKDARIQQLEEENALLRSQLLLFQQQRHATPVIGNKLSTSAAQRQTPLQQSSGGGRQQQHSNSAPSGRRRRRRTKGTTTTRKQQQQDEERVFSPGTKFVAELAQLTEIEVGSYAPLSYIIDKHWDKLAPYDQDDDEDQEEDYYYTTEDS